MPFILQESFLQHSHMGTAKLQVQNRSTHQEQSNTWNNIFPYKTDFVYIQPIFDHFSVSKYTKCCNSTTTTVTAAVVIAIIIIIKVIVIVIVITVLITTVTVVVVVVIIIIIIMD